MSGWVLQSLSPSTHGPVVGLCVSYHRLQETSLMRAEWCSCLWVQQYFSLIFTNLIIKPESFYCCILYLPTFYLRSCSLNQERSNRPGGAFMSCCVMWARKSGGVIDPPRLAKAPRHRLSSCDLSRGMWEDGFKGKSPETKILGSLTWSKCAHKQ